jgi:hypothetical protein
MVAVAFPFKHPKTGVYWFRRAGPADLREKLGREIKKTLGTKDLTEAKRLFTAKLAECGELFRKTREGVTPSTDLSDAEISRLAKLSLSL